MVTENAEALVAQRATMAAVNFMLVYILWVKRWRI